MTDKRISTTPGYVGGLVTGHIAPAVQPKSADDALLIDNLFRATLSRDSDAIDRARMALRERMNELRAAAAGVDSCRAAGEDRSGWKSAAIAWMVCSSLHSEYASGKDPLFTTRQADFTRKAEEARAHALGVRAVDHRRDFENEWIRYAGHLPKRDGDGYAHGPIDLAWRFWKAARGVMASSEASSKEGNAEAIAACLMRFAGYTKDEARACSRLILSRAYAEAALGMALPRATDLRDLANIAHAQAEHYLKTGEALPGFTPADGVAVTVAPSVPRGLIHKLEPTPAGAAPLPKWVYDQLPPALLAKGDAVLCWVNEGALYAAGVQGTQAPNCAKGNSNA